MIATTDRTSAAEPVLAIEARQLSKNFGDDIRAVDGLDLSIPTGSIYALLGPNGAGKTTTISMLTTLLHPSSGEAQVLGYDVSSDPAEVRKRIGVTFQETVLDSDLTGRQILDFNGQLYGMTSADRNKKIENLLALVELEDAATRRVGTYSGGMKRRLELARGLMTDPELLFLDEPTLGLDPQSRMGIWGYIKELGKQKGMTIVLTTHYLEEAEALADLVGIIDHGRLVIEGGPKRLIEEMGADVIHLQGDGEFDAFILGVKKLPFVETTEGSGDYALIGVDTASKRLPEVLLVAHEAGFEIHDVSIARPGLNDVFLKYTGTQYRDV